MRTLFFNGIQGSSGAYAQNPVTPKDLAAKIANDLPMLRRIGREQFRADFQNQPIPELDEISQLARRQEAFDDLQTVGWGILYPEEQTSWREDLKDLLDLRRQHAGIRYQEIPYQKGMSARDLLEKLDVPKDDTAYQKCPYYLLILGSPEDIPFQVQLVLDRRYAVGRLYLESRQAYRDYANTVVNKDQNSIPQLKATFFAPTHPNDPPTQLTSSILTDNLARRTKNSFGGTRCHVGTRIGNTATKKTLKKLMGGPLTPDLLFVASHGEVLNTNTANNQYRQGAPICAEWPGPVAWKGKDLKRRMVFYGDDLNESADFNGMIAILYGCFSGGTPQNNSFPFTPFTTGGTKSPTSYIAHLPKRMMSLPNGCRAIIANLDTTFIWSFTDDKKRDQTIIYQTLIRDLIEGRPIGLAMAGFQEAYLNRKATFLDRLKEYLSGELEYEEERLVQAWFAVNDLRNHILLGDPAVQLTHI